MELISSDTNVWVDFAVINRLNLPFLLPYTYIMYEESMDNELLYPPGIREDLKSKGLQPVQITIEEFSLAQNYAIVYKPLSVEDRIALAVAKNRGIKLLTGDKAMRNAASIEGVKVIGTLGILDKLINENFIIEEEYAYCLSELKRLNGRNIRLPVEEIEKRMKRIKRSE